MMENKILNSFTCSGVEYKNCNIKNYSGELITRSKQKISHL